jgi:hypothetical protein
MLEETKKKRYNKNPYGTALNMNANEKKISFLNRYFVYKKIRNVNAEKISLELLDESMDQARVEQKETTAAVKVAKEEVKTAKPRVRKLTNKLLLVAATEALDEPVVATNEKKPRVKKTKLKLEE